MRGLPLLVTGCGGPFGLSQVGNEGDIGHACESADPELTALQPGDPIWEGYTRDAVLAALSVTESTEATYQPGEETRVGLDLEMIPSPESAQIASRQSPCLSEFSVGGALSLSTADGALDEAWTFSLTWTETERTYLRVSFGADSVEGTLDGARWLDKPEGTPFSVFGEVEVVEEDRTHGSIWLEAESAESAPGVPSPVGEVVTLLSW